MKKLIFALAVCAVCGMAQAASLVWGTSGNAVDENGGLVSSAISDGKLVLAPLGTSTDGNWTGGYDSAVAVQYGSWNVASSKGSYSSKVSTTYYGGSTLDAYGTGTLAKNNVYAIMFQDSNGDLHQLKDGSGNLINSYYWQETAPAETDAFTFTVAGNVAATSAGYSDIPEPTSGLLLALGMCALALRRRKM